VQKNEVQQLVFQTLEFKLKVKKNSEVSKKRTCNNSWNTKACFDGLLRADNGSTSSLVTTVSGVMEYGAETVTPAVNFTVNVSNGGGVSPALEYFEFVGLTFSVGVNCFSRLTLSVSYSWLEPTFCVT